VLGFISFSPTYALYEFFAGLNFIKFSPGDDANSAGDRPDVTQTPSPETGRPVVRTRRLQFAGSPNMNFLDIDKRNGSSIWIDWIVFGKKDAVLDNEEISQW
jgi:hypothetical protein